jgi:RHH-type proline utilization regulon transcriptional repressor/proline dehydrogenase/delta 1-pyrroline-5-carboxylate dehydrogenase
VHSRIDETIDFVTSRAHVGNAYVNRNIIGAVVGVQPFGGEGLSGTGPKAGGPLYLRRLMREGPMPRLEGARDESVLDGFDRLAALPEAAPLAGLLAEYRAASPLPVTLTLPGPVGETNSLRFAGRGQVLVLAGEMSGLLTGLAAALATGNAAIAPPGPEVDRLNARLPAGITIRTVEDWRAADCAVVLVFTPFDAMEARKIFAFREGPLVPVIDRIEPAALLRLVAERTLSVNEAAAGGNAELMTI